MNKINWTELFPTKSSVVVFVSYIVLFVNQGILVTASQGSKNEYDYSVAAVVLLTEILKLFLSILLYCKSHSLSSLTVELVRKRKLLALYLVPAGLYCAYNNLAFASLAAFDPTTYYLIFQLRVVVTGVLFQILFKKYLSKIQWLSLFLLTIGCMLKQVNLDYVISTTTGLASRKNTHGLDTGLPTLLILSQILCSCLAGVYNERLLKHEGASVHVALHNICMYLDSILCNLVLLVHQPAALQSHNLTSLLRVDVFAIIINNAVVGIVTSLFLKSLNSILKTFTSAIDLVVIAVTSYVVFGVPIHLNTVLAILVVSSALVLYSCNPVVNYGVGVKKGEKILLKEEV